MISLLLVRHGRAAKHRRRDPATDTRGSCARMGLSASEAEVQKARATLHAPISSDNNEYAFPRSSDGSPSHMSAMRAGICLGIDQEHKPMLNSFALQAAIWVDQQQGGGIIGQSLVRSAGPVGVVTVSANHAVRVPLLPANLPSAAKIAGRSLFQPMTAEALTLPSAATPRGKAEPAAVSPGCSRTRFEHTEI
jgi:hypothetical protein